MKYLLAVLLLLCALPCTAQKQGNIWYFGDRVGVDFNSGTPVPIHDGQTYNRDGHSDATSVIANDNGALLFYTNGEKIWNRNHQVMPNGDGLLGSYSSTQGSLIIPRPGSNTIYYVFTTDAFYPNGLKYGLRYSVVDICRDSGRGDVIPERKNVPLLESASEKLCATIHADGTNVWVVTHEFGTDAFYAYLLTERGIVDTVVTHIGSKHRIKSPFDPNYQGDAAGQMKISPDGRLLGLCNANSVRAVGPAVVEIFRFDNATGVPSDVVNLTTDAAQALGDPYGLTFSPDSRMLYICRKITITQYDVSTWETATIRASMTEVAPAFQPPRTQGVEMQLGPDGRIYIPATRYLDVIANPNVPGTGCGYSPHAVDLDTNYVRSSSYGLPSFIDSYRYTSRGICQKDQIYLPDITGQTGTEMSVPVKIKFGSEFTAREPRRFSATLRFNRSLLYPTAENTVSAMEGQDRVVTFSDTWDGRSDVLGYLRALVGVTNAERIPMALTGFTWESDDQTELAGGNVDLTGFCEAGGSKRMIEVGTAGLKLTPNPARGLARVEFSTPESGRTRLYILDAAGRIVTTIADRELRSGDHAAELDLSGIATGSYSVVLQTPTQRIVSPMQIVE